MSWSVLLYHSNWPIIIIVYLFIYLNDALYNFINLLLGLMLQNVHKFKVIPSPARPFPMSENLKLQLLTENVTFKSIYMEQLP